jgi:hypothetical protein
MARRHISSYRSRHDSLVVSKGPACAFRKELNYAMPFSQEVPNLTASVVENSYARNVGKSDLQVPSDRFP